jgi:transposase
MQELVTLSGCQITSIECSKDKVIIKAQGKSKTAPCPSCGKRSSSIHSWYKRSPADLSISDKAVALELEVRRFRCKNQVCTRTTFAERFPSVVHPRVQCTIRLAEMQSDMGIKVGGEVGSKLLTKLHMPTSGDTLLRLVRKAELPKHESPRMVGVDDWSFHKGKTFGTILVDLEKHCVLDLLGDRTAETLAAWLKQYPDIEIISRDRSHDYARAAREAVPKATQVADRWHLLHNLQQMLTRWFQSINGQLRRLPLDEAMRSEAARLFPQKVSLSKMTKAQKAASQATREKRMTQFVEVKKLYAKGTPLLTISKQLGINRQTARAYAYADHFPERSPLPPKPNLLDPYLAYLEKRQVEGCENACQLWREIQAQGFTGKRWTVLRWMQFRRKEPSKHGPYKHQERSIPQQEPLKHLPLPSANQLAWILFQDEVKLSEAHQFLRKHLLRDKDVQSMLENTTLFKETFQQRKPKQLDTWLETSRNSGITALQTFAEGIKQDYSAVKAALELPWSNGQTEGQVTKLKLIKRQMFGRANFDLLRRRVLLN